MIVFSFGTDCHMIVDGTVLVTLQKTTDYLANRDAGKSQEALWPSRHLLTLPINSLNILFTDCVSSINNHTQITADR
jgi:hypothetical protein